VKRKQKRQANASGEQCCEICLVQTFLVQHHILGRKIIKANKHNNLANVCSNCHTKIHKGDIIIEKRAMTSNGMMLLWHEKTSESITGDDSIVHTY